MRVLVTGGLGFIGRNTVPTLLAANHEVVMLVREGHSADLSRHPSVPCVSADLRDKQQTQYAIQQAAPEIVLHLAADGATNPYLETDKAIATNVNGTINLLEAAFEATSVQQFIVARTPGEHDAMNPYAASKAAAWKFCEMYTRTKQWPIVGAMIYQAYGWRQPVKTLIPSAFAAAAADQDFAMTAGTQKKDWIHVQDVAQGLAAIVGQTLPPATTLALGTGDLMSVADVVSQIYKLTKSKGNPLIGSLPSRIGEVATQVADCAETVEKIGWQSNIDVSAGLAMYWQSLRSL